MEQTAPLEVGLAVVDLERMCDFYTRVLGCTEVRRMEIPAGLSGGLKLAADGYVCVWMQTPHGEVIKLMRPPRAPAADAKRAWLTGRTGFAYLTFYCRNAVDVLTTAESAGGSLRSDRALLDGAGGLKLCFFADPEDNVIELVERDE